jgi:hypothetical protein
MANLPALQMGPVKANFMARDSLAGHQFDTARVNVKRRCIVGRPDEDLQVAYFAPAWI